MQLDTAVTAGTLAEQIQALQAALDKINGIVGEAGGWELFNCKVRAKDIGASSPAGTVVDLLGPVGAANDANTLAALRAAATTYQSALDALNAQLAGL